LHVNEVMKASCSTSWLHKLDLEDYGFLVSTQK
jgi:hypothetical protein